MTMQIMDMIKVVIWMQLFFAISMTIYTHALPEDALDYVTGYQDLADNIDINSVSDNIQSSLQRQSNIPVIETGALIFYSGNILLDLLLNFTFAVPQMFTLLINGLMLLLGIDAMFMGFIQLFLSVGIMAVYFISIIQLLVGIRSGRIV